MIVTQQTFTVPNDCHHSTVCFIKVLSYRMYIFNLSPKGSKFKWTFTFPGRETQKLNQNEVIKQY